MKRLFAITIAIVITVLFWYGVESSEVEDGTDLIRESLNKSALIEDRYIAVFKENCTEEDINYVVAAMGQAARNGLAGDGPVKNFSTLAHLTSGIMGIIFNGDKAAVDKVKFMCVCGQPPSGGPGNTLQRISLLGCSLWQQP